MAAMFLHHVTVNLLCAQLQNGNSLLLLSAYTDLVFSYAAMTMIKLHINNLCQGD